MRAIDPTPFIQRLPPPPAGTEQRSTSTKTFIEPRGTLVNVHRFADTQTTAHGGHDPSLAIVLGVTDADEREAFVSDMQVPQERWAGLGGPWWQEIEQALIGAGIVRVRLDAQDIGGYFWIGRGFELAQPTRDVPHVLAHARRRLSVLETLGVPGIDESLAWMSEPSAASEVAARGLLWLVTRLGRSPVPVLDEHDMARRRHVALAACVLAHSTWTGVKTLPSPASVSA